MMQAINLDYISTRNPSVLGGGVLALAIIVALGSWYYQNNVSQRLIDINLQVQQLRDASGIKKTTTSKRQSSPELQAKIEFAKQQADFLLMPWGDVFSAMEAASIDDAALLSLEPDPKKRQLKITVEAKNKDVMFSYIQRLEETPELFGVYLLKHEIMEDVEQHPIRFVAVANWKQP